MLGTIHLITKKLVRVAAGQCRVSLQQPAAYPHTQMQQGAPAGEASRTITLKDHTYNAFAKFKDKRELYQGRYSKVWACHWQQTTTQIVLKAYYKSRMRPRHRENVRRELSILSCLEKLRCTGIVAVLGSFEDEEAIYVVQEYCARGDLFGALHKSGGCMAETWVACQVVIPLLQTLQAAHQQGVIHRDIKPENIFLTEAGTLRLGDWGLAINQLQEKAYSRVGTLDYMAPEVLGMPAPEDFAAGRARLQHILGYNEKVDIWAVGVLVYELMGGRPPFEVCDAQSTADLIMHGQIEEFPMACSGYCVHFIKQALVKSPDNRPGATELLSHPWLTPYTSQTPPTPASGPHTPRQTREFFHAQHQLHQPPGDHEQASDTLLQMSDLQDLKGVKRCAQQYHNQGGLACDWATDSCPEQQDSVPDQVKQTASVLGANQEEGAVQIHCKGRQHADTSQCTAEKMPLLLFHQQSIRSHPMIPETSSSSAPTLSDSIVACTSLRASGNSPTASHTSEASASSPETTCSSPTTVSISPAKGATARAAPNSSLSVGNQSGTSSPHLRRDRELSNNKEGELAGHSSSYGCPHAHFLNGFEYNQEADMRQQEGRTATNSLASQPCAGSPFCAVDGISTHCQQVQSHGEGRSKAAAFVSSVEAGDSSAASNGVPGVLLAISDLFSAATVCFGMENCPSYLR